MKWRYFELIFAFFALVIFSCSSEGNGEKALEVPSPQETINLTDFKEAVSCKPCHPVQYEEWQYSMHAYSMKDPVFHSGWEGEKTHRPDTGERFCIQCHSPYAYVTGSEVDTTVAQIAEGIGCDLCHTMVASHDQIITDDNVAASAEYFLNAEKDIRFGEIMDPVDNGFHESVGIAFFNSSRACLPCHDFIIRGVDAEITFSEWAGSGFAAMSMECQSCHMQEYEGYAADPIANPGVPKRIIHDHSMVGVDLDLKKSLADNPQGEAVVDLLQSAAVLDLTDSPTIVNDTLQLSFTIQNLTGHSFPTGVSFVRELWMELQVYDESQVYFSSGILETDSSDLGEEVEIFNAELFDGQGIAGVGVTDVVSMTNNSLQANEARVKTFSTPITSATDSITVAARLLFRSFPPSSLREQHQDLLANLPVITIDSLSFSIAIP